MNAEPLDIEGAVPQDILEAINQADNFGRRNRTPETFMWFYSLPRAVEELAGMKPISVDGTRRWWNERYWLYGGNLNLDIQELFDYLHTVSILPSPDMLTETIRLHHYDLVYDILENEPKLIFRANRYVLCNPWQMEGGTQTTTEWGFRLPNGYRAPDLTYRECDRETDMLPIHVACINNAPVDVIRKLTPLVRPKTKSLIRSKCSEGRNLPLHYACMHGASMELVQFLVNEYPRGLRAANRQGLSPLDCACLAGIADKELIRFLATKFVGTFGEYGKQYPIQVAMKYNMPAMAFECLLEDFSANGTINRKGDDGLCPLLSAAASDSPLYMVDYLMRADPVNAVRALLAVVDSDDEKEEGMNTNNNDGSETTTSTDILTAAAQTCGRGKKRSRDF